MRVGTSLGDHGLGTALARRATVSGGIVAAVAVDEAALLKPEAGEIAKGGVASRMRQRRVTPLAFAPVRIATTGTPLAYTGMGRLAPGRALGGLGPGSITFREGQAGLA
ncbi:hypothetical protein EFP19_18545 [Burkholderia glumae]|nr:hypothetical protein EFP19_18545 [Burkholderia glumae]